ncbi:hypothetical protein C8Q69DRAFT_499131 [Paecilomyces variotii]|uniref:Zn(2)-C6 fungal-type domain-containing protein n=1 Tax=Byssochlamys spectabilis TaxID=264951 RepID=A0A443HR90_BYSSP|nr:hypothetical protein C8Q69DRAFT_499131 [Paecilomyces variotii]KAJ9365687.1 transcriptional regulator family: Fungal Specific TF [Paecilomyces variotii]RWQ94343.1 hypothetical protein C8Q69DRAFT_499131 [Paecilomyces variotii]
MSSRPPDENMTLPACDLCYIRKVKCDREKTCKNCANAQVKCCRTRPKRHAPSRRSRMSTLAERLTNLENTAHVISQLDSPSSPPEAARRSRRESSAPRSHLYKGGSHPDHEKTSTRPQHSHVVADEEPSHRTNEAREFIQQELDHNILPQERQAVFESALQLINQLPHLSGESNASGLLGTSDLSPSVICTAAPAELLYMMLPAFARRTGIGACMEWPDHISTKTLERMTLTLIEGHPSQQLLLQYRVCVYIKAFFFTIMRANPPHSNSVLQRLEESRSQYAATALDSLSRIGLLSPPSLPLVQALLSGAIFMQYVGNMSQSWMLTAAAARAIVSLNYHTTFQNPPVHETDEEIRFSVYWCYYLDKVLSLLLVRPPSLPRLNASPVSLIRGDVSDPPTIMLQLLLTVAETQENGLDLMQGFGNEGKENIDVQFERLDKKVKLLRERIDHVRSTIPGALATSWMDFEYGYYAIQTNVFQYRLRRRRCYLYQGDCLFSARKALSILLYLQHRSAEDSEVMEPFPSFLTWTVLLYPLSPFFVLFCNVVSISSIEDFALLKDATLLLSRYKNANPSLLKLHNLLNAFLNLCKNLITSGGSKLASSPIENHQTINIGTDQNGDSSRRDNTPSLAMLQSLSEDNAASVPVPPIRPFSTDSHCFSSVQVPIAVPFPGTGHGAATSLSTDDLMWELFTSQPSVDWLESGVWKDTSD